MTAHRLAAIAAAFSWVVAGSGCNESQSGPEIVASAKPDAGIKKPDARHEGAGQGQHWAARCRRARCCGRHARRLDRYARCGDAAAGDTTDDGHGRNDATGDGHRRNDAARDRHGRVGRAADGRAADDPAGHAADGRHRRPPPVRRRSRRRRPRRPRRTLRIAAIGDYGEDVSEEGQVANLVRSWKPDQVITLGDNNYQAGAASTIDANIGKYYHDFIGNYRGSYGAGSATNKFWPSPGNHDWAAPNLTPYTDYFTLPGNERYYDVDLGLVHLYAMDSDEHEPDGNKATSKQALWLKDKLAASKSCYDLVYFHYPAYSTGDHGSDTDLRWPFETWGADAVMSGHDHSYERFQVGGIPYFVNGLGAAGIYKFDKSAAAGDQVPLRRQARRHADHRDVDRHHVRILDPRRPED